MWRGGGGGGEWGGIGDVGGCNWEVLGTGLGEWETGWCIMFVLTVLRPCGHPHTAIPPPPSLHRPSPPLQAQNIKNFKSQRWQTLLSFNSQRRLLLTGTPLQNSVMELWSLMHFLMPSVFSSHTDFKEWFSNPLTGMVEGSQEYSETIVRRLHKVGGEGRGREMGDGRKKRGERGEEGESEKWRNLLAGRSVKEGFEEMEWSMLRHEAMSSRVPHVSHFM